MKIEFGDTIHDIELDPAASIEANLEMIESHPAFKEAITYIADDANFATYYHHPEMKFPDSQAQELLAAFLAGGFQNVVALLDRYNLQNRNTEDDVYFSHICDKTSCGNLQSEIALALEHLHGRYLTIGERQQVDSAVQRACVVFMEENDKSQPMDAIPDWLWVEACYIPGFGENPLLDDWRIYGVGPGISAKNVVPNDCFAAFLRMINVSSAAYLHIVDSEVGVRLDVVPTEKELFETDTTFNGRVANAHAWQNFNVPADPSKPPLLSPAKIVEVMDNANYGGSPVLVCMIKLRSFLTHDWSKPTHIVGGEIGIHNFLNGSGHLVKHKRPVDPNETFRQRQEKTDTFQMALPAGTANWIEASRFGAAKMPSDIYSIITSYWYSKLTTIDAPIEDRPAITV